MQQNNEVVDIQNDTTLSVDNDILQIGLESFKFQINNQIS